MHEPRKVRIDRMGARRNFSSRARAVVPKRPAVRPSTRASAGA